MDFMFLPEKKVDFTQMILVSLNGGLGNQLFQYALGRRLAHERGVELRFDLSLLAPGLSLRQYRLDGFRVYGSPVSAQELKRFYFLGRNRYFRNLDAIAQGWLPYYRRREVHEQSSLFDANILKVPSSAILHGYWQSEKYFSDIRSLLLQDLRLKVPFDEINQQLHRQICSTDSVNLHIRRGDYVQNPKTNQMHGVLPLDYYQRAMQKLEETVTAPHYYVFSDDIPWARLHLKDENITFVEHNGEQGDYIDLALMSACKYHILANSSFSWWAAWLSEYSRKQVFAPRQWYKKERDTRDLIPPDWTVL